MERPEAHQGNIVGRGAGDNPKNRFEKIEVEPEPGERDADGPATVYLRDHSRSIIVRNDSPDIGFDTSINPYRRCSHGCGYYYARPGPSRRLDAIQKLSHAGIPVGVMTAP